MEGLEEAPLLNEGGSDVVELGDANGRRLPDVRVLVPQGTTEGLAQVLGDSIDTDAPHGPHGEGADEGVGVAGILDEGVDGKEGELRLGLGVVDKVEVHEFLELDVPRLHAVEDVGEEHRNVLSDGHRGDDLLHGVDLGVAVGGVKLEAELVHLAFLLGGEEARVRSTGVLAGRHTRSHGWDVSFYSDFDSSLLIATSNGWRIRGLRSERARWTETKAQHGVSNNNSCSRVC